MRPGCADHSQGSGIPLNQNRNQNRRRGRGNNRGPGGGNQGNRIDSRARGNAPQMLEKYKKLAHDASLNGDRVLTEYYLQFADHYFRVVADSRVQKEDVRPRREHDREQPFESDEDETDEREETAAPDESSRNERPRRRRERNDEERAPVAEGQPGVEGEEAHEVTASDNPFVREARGARRSRSRQPANGSAAEAPAEAEASTIDAGILPPSIPRAEEREEVEAKAPTKRRTRRSPPADDGDQGALEAVS